VIPFEEFKKRYRDFRLQFHFDYVFVEKNIVIDFGMWLVKFIEYDDIDLFYKMAGNRPFFVRDIHPKCGLGVDIGTYSALVEGYKYTVESYLKSRSRNFRKAMKRLERKWEGGKVVFEKQVFNDFNEFYDAFELYFMKWGFVRELVVNGQPGGCFVLIQGLPVWVVSLYEPKGNFVGRILLVQVDNWYYDFCFAWDEAYKHLHPGTYGIWSILKHFILGKDAVYSSGEVGFAVSSGGVELCGDRILLSRNEYLYKARFGISRLLGIYIDKNNVLNIPNANKITENEYFKFPD
jgi:hypothetical protein